MTWILLLASGLAGVAGAHEVAISSQPRFTSSPTPVRAAHVRWKASDPLARGIESWAAGKRAKALRWFEYAVHRIPGDPIAWHNLGVALYSASRFEEAHHAFRWERLLTPSAPSAWYGIGMCERVAGRLAEAENAFIVAVNQAPREWEYWHQLGEILTAQGKAAPALYASDRAARLRPRGAPNHRFRGRWHTSIMGIKVPPIPTTFPR